MAEKQTGLQRLREPFPDNQISQLPKPTKAQTDAVKKDFKTGVRCKVCGGWHHPKVIHLDYVGHAALTDRLLDCDPEWNWKPVSVTENGLPVFDDIGGLWIYLTVCGVTRMGYGHAENKQGGDAIKEIIGDALRNAAMRFGAALDLWHKGKLHDDTGNDEPDPKTKAPPKQPPKPDDISKFIAAVDKLVAEKQMPDEILAAFLEGEGVKKLADLKTREAQKAFYKKLQDA